MWENEGVHFIASNPAQKLRARFLSDGLRLLSGYPGRNLSGVIGLALVEGGGEPVIAWRAACCSSCMAKASPSGSTTDLMVLISVR